MHLLEFRDVDPWAVPQTEDQIISLAKRFNDQLGYVDFDWKKAYEFLTISCQKDSDLYVLVAIEDSLVVGLLAGLVSQPAFSSDWFAVEVGWFVEPEYRGTKQSIQMLQLFEAWAKKKGATKVAMVSQSRSDVDPSVLYERRGYQLSEKTFVKDL